MKKRVLLLIILFIFPILVNASTISRDNVSTSTYIIGKYMFTRETNPSTGYEGGLTTKMIMLASKTLNGDSLSEMIIYYKKTDGTWIDALTGNKISVPSSFNIEVTNLSGSASPSTISLNTTSYSSSTIGSSTYIIGKHMFTRETNPSTGYDGGLTTKMIMLASKTLSSNSLSGMVIYYKKTDGTWIDALTGNKISVPSSFEIGAVNLAIQNQSSGDVVVSEIEGGTTLATSTQTLKLRCTNATAYYFGTTRPTSASSITTTTSSDLTSLASTNGLSKNVTSSGTYYFACKNSSGNYGIKSIILRKYQVAEIVEKLDGTADIYSSANYKALPIPSTYIVKDGTTLILSSIRNVPISEGAVVQTFKGYTTTELSTTIQKPSMTDPVVASNDTTIYYMWFNRKILTVTINKSPNGKIKLETVGQPNNNVTVSNNDATLSVKSGDRIKATATANSGYNFNGWTGGFFSGNTNPLTSSTLQNTMNNIVISALFSNYTIGDVNKDNTINNSDLTAIQNYLKNTQSFNESQRGASDIDSDGYVSYNDYLLLKKYLNGENILLGSPDNQILHMIPGDFNLDSKISNEDKTLFDDFLKNSNRELAPYIQTWMDLNDDGVIDSSDLTILSTLVSKNFNLADIDELQTLKTKNSLAKSDDLVLEETEDKINGITFKVYYMFNIKTEYDEVSYMKQFSSIELNNSSKIDLRVLQLIKNSGVKIFYLASSDYYLNVPAFSWAGAYSHSSRSVIMVYQRTWLNQNWNTLSLTHELGHAYDNAVSDKLAADIGGMTKLADSDIVNGFSKGRKNILPSSFADFFYENRSWVSLAELECEGIKKNYSSFSAYTIDRLKTSPSEYFAEAFKNYYHAKDKLEQYAPKTYQSMVRAINTSIY